ncbi:MAG TPA: hypothetical protein VKB67_08730 [Rhizomicrobium sp.]|nr:hypothetical protein [Rhizomicrobium sp.]
MEHRRTFQHGNFGRRAAPQVNVFAPVIGPGAAPMEEKRPVPPADPMPAGPSIEDEIRAWKSARGSLAGFPWRQLSLMAGLCFGFASFVLPASVNEAAQWPLYVLAAISFYAGLHKRKVKPG